MGSRDIRRGYPDIWAEKISMATNGYPAYLYPSVKGIIIALRGTVAAPDDVLVHQWQWL